MSYTDLDAYCAANQERHVEELIEFLRIPSISADPAHSADVRRNAEYLAAEARKIGFQKAELIETAGHPAVYAERMVDPSLPTALIYGHHDVQPVDPLGEWKSSPFERAVRDGKLAGAGSVAAERRGWRRPRAGGGRGCADKYADKARHAAGACPTRIGTQRSASSSNAPTNSRRAPRGFEVLVQGRAQVIAMLELGDGALRHLRRPASSAW